MWIRRPVWCSVATASLLLLWAGQALAQSDAQTAHDGGADAGYLGAAVCGACHVVETSHWDRTGHARAFRANPRTSLEAQNCEACHGPGKRHLEDPTDRTLIVAFTRNSAHDVHEQNGMCLQCHDGGERIRWPGSAHELADVACSDCHNPMTKGSARRLMRESSVSATCFSCHPAQRVAFRKRSHMPLLEGKISCEDCHNPHGSATDPLLRGDSVNHTCYTCHPEKRGPFLWEHAPVRESCLNCHRPHGSNHDKLLTTIATTLCQTCHSQVGHPSDLLTAGNLAGGAALDERVMNRGCVNCHAQIHGSNHPSGPRFHR